MASAVCIGAESLGLMMQPKHFAFNHQASNRCGLSTFMCEQGARACELRCFQMFMSNNYTSGIMTAFNHVGVAYLGAYKNLLVNIASRKQCILPLLGLKCKIALPFGRAVFACWEPSQALCLQEFFAAARLTALFLRFTPVRKNFNDSKNFLFPGVFLWVFLGKW